MGRSPLPAYLISELSGLRDGDLAAADFMKLILSCCGFELHSRAIVGRAKVCWVVDISHDVYLREGCLSILDVWLRWANAVQASLDDWLKGGRRTFLSSFWNSCLEDMWGSSPEEPSEPSIPSYAVVVLGVVLLALVYHYLTGNVDRGGSRAHSRSSLDFRDIYVAVVLFLGAYVWIKFREAAPKGVHPRKVGYDARLTPPMWNGRKVPRLELGRFATPQEARNKFLIAAFYYKRAAGVLDGWFQVPPMSEEERRLTGLELRAWVLGQAKKVYEDFEKEKAEAALLLQELLEGCEGQATQERVEVTVDFSMASLLNSAEPQQPALVSEVETSGMGMAMLDNHGLECASHSIDGMHEGPALSNGLSLGSQEEPVLSVSLLPPNTESGNGSDPLDLLQTRVSTQQQQISLQQQQIYRQQQQLSDQQQQISLQQQQFDRLQQLFSDQQRQSEELRAHVLQFQSQKRVQQQQQLQESRIQNPQWPCQEQQLQDVNQGFLNSEVATEEQSMHQHNYSGLMAPPPDGGEVQEALWELDTPTYM